MSCTRHYLGERVFFYIPPTGDINFTMKCIFSQDDPSLENKRRELIESAARALDKARMVRFEPRTGDLNVTGNVEINVIRCSYLYIVIKKI
jgi:hypothetical protein